MISGKIIVRGASVIRGVLYRLQVERLQELTRSPHELIYRKKATAKLSSVPAGTVAVSIADKDYMRRRERLEEWLEDGTASFLGVAALRHGFDAVEKLGMENIRR